MNPHPLPQERKLMVTYRVEPGCLGPEGKQHVEDFCHFAELGVKNLDADWVHWHIIPRYDKTLKELEYGVNGKRLNHDKADQYLSIFGQSLDEFEHHLEERLATLVDEFFTR